MLEITDLPPQIVPAVNAFAQRLSRHIRTHREASLEVHEAGVLAAWRAEGAAVLAGAVSARRRARILWRAHRGVRVRVAVVAAPPSGGVGARSRRNWAA